MQTKSLFLASLMAAALLVGGCATVGNPPAADNAPGQSVAASAAELAPAHPADPWEGFNRAMFAFNEALDRAVIKPVAQIYDTAMPELAKRGVRNFFGNLADLWIGANNLLQGKVGEAFSDWMRFGFNSTFGVFGLFDIASEAGLPKHNEDFGQTLARWGVGDGPYLVLPFLGPKTLRDAAAWPFDRWGNPTSHLEDDSARVAVKVVDVIDTRAALLPTDAERANAIDPYALVRDAYLQRRRYVIFDGNPPVRYDAYE